jgi:uncharacterized protein
MAVIQKGVDFLLTSAAPEVELQFFGGEPLLRFDLVRAAILYGERRAKAKGKKIKFLITTNGLLLSSGVLVFLKKHPVEIMFSMDGAQKDNDAHRFFKKTRKGGIYKQTCVALKLLMNSGVPYFVNMVVAPKTFFF